MFINELDVYFPNGWIGQHSAIHNRSLILLRVDLRNIKNYILRMDFRELK